MTTRISVLAVLAAALVAAPAAGARSPVTRYAGRTAQGRAIVLQIRKHVAWNIRTEVAVTCVASNQGVVSDPTPERFEPDWGFPVGHRVTATDRVGYPEHTYVVSTHRHRRRIAGSLTLRYSELTNSPVDGSIRAQTCSGQTRFTARPR